MLRIALGLTAADFAKLVGVSKSTIQHIETGYRVLKPAIADKIHVATGFPRSWLDRTTIELQEAIDWENGTDIEVLPEEQMERHSGFQTNRTHLEVPIFPQHLFDRIEAAFYLTATEGINPTLLPLALERCLSQFIIKNALKEEKIGALSQKIADYKADLSSGPRLGDANNAPDMNHPGYRALLESLPM